MLHDVYMMILVENTFCVDFRVAQLINSSPLIRVDTKHSTVTMTNSRDGQTKTDKLGFGRNLPKGLVHHKHEPNAYVKCIHQKYLWHPVQT